jgi:hypothetical protein
MQKVMKTGLVLSMAMIFGVGSALAADQIRTRDRKKDGTCKSAITKEINVAAEQSRKQLRKKDRSCQGAVAEEITLAAEQLRKRDRKRDGSCQTNIVEQDQGLILAADRDRVRNPIRDRSC